MSDIQSLHPVFPLGELFKSPYFNGKVYRQPMVPLNDLNCPTSNITFEPRCINNWHSHAGGQILLCTNGRGWYQEDGKAAQELHPGDVIQIPANIKHWHGAAKDSWFTHISISTNIQEGETEWLEPVNQKSYSQLP